MRLAAYRSGNGVPQDGWTMLNRPNYYCTELASEDYPCILNNKKEGTCKPALRSTVVVRCQDLNPIGPAASITLTLFLSDPNGRSRGARWAHDGHRNSAVPRLGLQEQTNLQESVNMLLKKELHFV